LPPTNRSAKQIGFTVISILGSRWSQSFHPAVCSWAGSVGRAFPREFSVTLAFANPVSPNRVAHCHGRDDLARTMWHTVPSTPETRFDRNPCFGALAHAACLRPSLSVAARTTARL